VKEALDETEALRKFYVQKYGKPKRTFVTGHSMGGTITLALAETNPEAYDGALQMCGPVGPIQTMFQRRLFDTLVVFDYYFPGMIGSPVQITDDIAQAVDFALRVQKEATSYPDKLSAFQKWSGFQSDLEVAQVVAFYAAIQKELMARAGGNAFDNRNTLYQGLHDDAVVNRGVARYTAEPKAVEYIRKYYTPKGDPKIPILSLHTTYDPLVPAWSANAYGEMLRLSGGDANYVQRFVGRNGHCTFTPQETQNAFRDLVKWKEDGKRPEAGEQK
jgi:pimeloyl-ACP methyl ester carboxylesterase